MKPLTMTEEQERELRGWSVSGPSLDSAVEEWIEDTRALLAEIDALRAQMPSESELAELKTLRELRASEHTASSVARMRAMCRGEVMLRVMPRSPAQAWWEALAALLAPEGEVKP